MKTCYSLFITGALAFGFNAAIAQTCLTDANYLGNDTKQSAVGSDTLAPDAQSYRCINWGSLMMVALDLSATNPNCTLSTMDVRVDILDGDSLNDPKLYTEFFTIPVDFTRQLDTFWLSSPPVVNPTQFYTVVFTLVPGQDCGNGEPDLQWYFEFPTNYWTNTGGTQYQNGVITSLGNTQYFTTCIDTACIIDATVTSNPPTLTANATGVSYQWLNCDSNYAVISGETSQNFTATANGSYAVEVSDSSCTDTSACETITGIGVLENNFGTNLSVYPNPSHNLFTINLGGNYTDMVVVVRNATGQEVMRETYASTNRVNLNLEGHEGIYFVELTTANQNAILKVIKQ